MKKEAFFCIDQNDTEGNPLVKKLYGPDDAFNHRHMEIMFKPCTPGPRPIQQAKEEPVVKESTTDLASESDDKTNSEDTRNL